MALGGDFDMLVHTDQLFDPGVIELKVIMQGHNHIFSVNAVSLAGAEECGL